MVIHDAAGRYGGTGLGLAITRKLARMMGGDWSTYLLLLLGAALAAASAMWFFLRMASIFARRAANSRMHMSNP